MASNAVGNLSVKLQLDAAQFSTMLQAAGVDVQQFANRTLATNGALQGTAMQGRAAGSSLQMLGPILNQASFGAADFASQLGTRGVGGALQAAANNIQVMGAVAGPWGLAISAAVGLGVQALGSYIEFQDKAAKKTEDSAQRRIDAEKRASEALQALQIDRDFASGLRGVRGGFAGTADQLSERLKALSREQSERLAKQDDIRRQMFERVPALNRNFTFEEARRGGMFENLRQTLGGKQLEGMPRESVIMLHELTTELKALGREGMIAGSEMANLQSQLPGLQLSEKRKADLEAAGVVKKAETDAANHLQAQADSIRSRFETDGERKIREFSDLRSLFDAGKFTTEEFGRYGREILGTEDKPTGPFGASDKAAGAFDFGSAEAMSSINRALRMTPSERDAKKTAEESAKTTEILRKSHRELEKISRSQNDIATGTISF